MFLGLITLQIPELCTDTLSSNKPKMLHNSIGSMLSMSQKDEMKPVDEIAGKKKCL